MISREKIGKREYDNVTVDNIVEALSKIAQIRITNVYNSDREKVEPVLLKLGLDGESFLTPRYVASRAENTSYTPGILKGTIIEVQPVRTSLHKKILQLVGISTKTNEDEISSDLIEFIQKQIGFTPFEKLTVETFWRIKNDPYIPPLPHIKYLEKIGSLDYNLILDKNVEQKFNFQDILYQGHIVKPITVRLVE